MIKLSVKEQFATKVMYLLYNIGIKVENDEIVAVLLEKGYKPNPDGRIGIPRELLEEMVLLQNQTQLKDDTDQLLHPLCGIDWAHHIIWRNQQEEFHKKRNSVFRMSAFDCGPTNYYGYISRRNGRRKKSKH